MSAHVSTFVDGHISAAHRDPLNGKLHGHTWRVRAYFNGEPWRDARSLQAAVRGLLEVFDHTELPEDLSSSEAMAAKLLHLLGGLPVERVDVWREPEGMGASACV